MFSRTILVLALCSASLEAAQRTQKSIETAKVSDDADVSPAVRTARRFAGHALAFTDARARIIALINIATAICSRDNNLADEFLAHAHGYLKIYSAEERARAEDEEKTRGVSSGGERRQSVAALRAWVISETRSCPSAYALRLRDDEVNETKERTEKQVMAWSNLRTAGQLLNKNSQEAAQVAEKALDAGVSEQTRMGMSALGTFLAQLHAVDEEAATRLFRQASAKLRNDPFATTDDVLGLGLYLFTAQALVTTPKMAAQLGINGIPTVDISARRPTASTALISDYLTTAAQILARPAIDSQYKMRAYVASLQLLPKFREYMPDTAGLIEGVLNILANDIGRSTEIERSDGAPDPESIRVEAAIDVMPGVQQRDERYAMLIARILREHKIARAKEIASKLHDSSIKDKVLNVIAFTEAVDLIDKQNVNRALELIYRRPAGLERSLVLLGASIAWAKKDPASAEGILLDAVRDIPAIDPKWKADFLMIAANVGAQVHRKLAFPLFTQAVTAFAPHERRAVNPTADTSANVSGAAVGKPLPSAQVGFSQIIGRVAFRLALKNVTDDKFAIIKRVAVIEPQSAEDAILAIQDEATKAQGMGVFVAALP